MTVTIAKGWSIHRSIMGGPPSFYEAFGGHADSDDAGLQITIPIELAYPNIHVFEEHEEIAEAWEKYDPRPIVITERVYMNKKRCWPWAMLALAVGFTAGWLI